MNGVPLKKNKMMEIRESCTGLYLSACCIIKHIWSTQIHIKKKTPARWIYSDFAPNKYSTILLYVIAVFVKNKLA